MKRALFLAAALICLSGSARAEPMHLTMQQAINVLDALGQLSAGEMKIVKEAAVPQHYKGWSMVCQQAQSKDINALRGPVQAYSLARQQRERDLSDDQGKLSKAAQNTFAKDDAAALAAVGTYDLDRFKLSDLLLDQNTIPPGVQANLAPILAPEK